jgi:hypothetical protein
MKRLDVTMASSGRTRLLLRKRSNSLAIGRQVVVVSSILEPACADQQQRTDRARAVAPNDFLTDVRWHMAALGDLLFFRRDSWAS